MATMNDRYGDGSDHEVCAKCGLCKECGDCEAHGCGGIISQRFKERLSGCQKDMPPEFAKVVDEHFGELIDG